MVHEHGVGHPKLFETLDNAFHHLAAARCIERKDPDRESTVIVQKAQGITSLHTTQDVFTLDVHLPQLVRIRPLKTFHCWTASIPLPDQSVAIYDPIDRRSREVNCLCLK